MATTKMEIRSAVARLDAYGFTFTLESEDLESGVWVLLVTSTFGFEKRIQHQWEWHSTEEAISEFLKAEVQDFFEKYIDSPNVEFKTTSIEIEED